MAKRYPGQGFAWFFWYLLAFFAFVVLLVACPRAHAQTSTRTAVITLVAPTRYTDGSAITAGTSISYRVYQGARGGTKTQVGTITSTSTTISTGLQAGQEYCWEVTAVINGVESARSNEGCKAFAFPTPETVTITVT